MSGWRNPAAHICKVDGFYLTCRRRGSSCLRAGNGKIMTQQVYAALVADLFWRDTIRGCLFWRTLAQQSPAGARLSHKQRLECFGCVVIYDRLWRRMMTLWAPRRRAMYSMPTTRGAIAIIYFNFPSDVVWRCALLVWEIETFVRARGATPEHPTDNANKAVNSIYGSHPRCTAYCVSYSLSDYILVYGGFGHEFCGHLCTVARRKCINWKPHESCIICI